ncbi:MAG: hypothetical protein MEP57_05800 [Microvirga sp.]|nr:hypothetical protein [Microvirga sp.]
MVKGPIRNQGPQRVGPIARTREEKDFERRAREFQAILRREYREHNEAAQERGELAVAFDERVLISGERASEAVGVLEELFRLSPTFRSVVEKAFSELDTLWIVIGRGGGPSRSTIGARDEKIWINLDQGDLRDLIIHECGHALAKLEDGPLGGFGPNQRFQAVIKRELDLGRGGIKPYGAEVEPNAPG